MCVSQKVGNVRFIIFSWMVFEYYGFVLNDFMVVVCKQWWCARAVCSSRKCCVITDKDITTVVSANLC